MKGSACARPVSVSNWRQITRHWSAFTRARQSLALGLRLLLRLQGYDFNVVSRPEKTNVAHALSRLNLRNSQAVGRSMSL